MIGDSGHVVSYEQIEADMRMIKSTGSNFVRLVHYPHCKATPDIADKLGLMVSEEPASKILCKCKLLERLDGTPLTLVSEGGDLNALMEGIFKNEERALPFRSTLRPRRLKNPPVIEGPEISGISPIPAVLGDSQTLIYEGECKTDAITLIGAVSVNKGYPISGELDEEAARITVVFEDVEQSFPVRNGRELSTVFSTIGSSRIDPRASNAPRFAEISYDLNFEQYVINRLTIQLDSMKTIKRVEISSLDNGYQMLIYGILAK